MPTIKNLTIAVLTHRRPTQLATCLASIRSQKYQPAKIVVVEDLPNITSIPQKRNHAISICKTKYLAFIDDDCTVCPHWTKIAHQYITKSKVAFVVGSTLPSFPLNYFSRLQFQSYQEWHHFCLKTKKIHNIFDTKNVIVDLSKINQLRFDENLPIFEDIDFGLQLKKQRLKGAHSSKMICYHQENLSPLKHFFKSFRRGRYKKVITAKWGNFDNYHPSFSLAKPLSTIFSLGYVTTPLPRIDIINSLDKGANGERAKHFYQFIKSRFHNTHLLDSNQNFHSQAFTWSNIIFYRLNFIIYHFFQVTKYIFNHDYPQYHFLAFLKLRGQILHRYLRHNHTSLAIIQYPEDIFLPQKRPYKILYDSPTIYAKELNNDPRYLPQILHQENKLYAHADFVSFHWYTYFNLIHNQKIFPKKEIIINWGCQISPKISQYSTTPRVVYLGILNSPWVNPQLLINLSKTIPIDVYGYEAPSPEFYPKGSINYLGYLPNLSDLSHYQFGLITITKDNLRSHGFSAKYLDYLNHGLPVLCPAWRQDQLLLPATIQYNESNIGVIYKRFCQQEAWQEKHLAALKLSQELNWDKNLQPLLKLIHEAY